MIFKREPKPTVRSTEQHTDRLRDKLERYAGVRHPANVVAEQIKQEDSIAERLARKITDFMATANFLIWQTLVIILWVAYNTALAHYGIAFDKFPFILLNLAFSTQAAYAAPLILLAGKKQEARARVQADLDFDHNARALEILRIIASKLDCDTKKVDTPDDQT